MAVYTYTPPHTPSSYTMNTTLPPLPIEILSTWSTWRPPKLETPLTPPHSTLTQRRVVQPVHQYQQSLPPIAHLDRQLSRLSPITPPQDNTSQWHTYGPPDLKLPPVLNHVPQPPQEIPSQECPPLEADEYMPGSRSSSPAPTHATALDWFTPSAQRSSQFIAEKTCEMVCYLWFSTLSQTSSPKRSRHPQHPPSYYPELNADTAYLQFAVSPSFVRFMQKVLETTQVSQSVIVLSLHYIYRLKLRNRFTNGQAGSEYRVAIASLMLANKFVDDNTYTNKTWSEVSGIELSEVNRMEREFLMGIDFDLYVDYPTYESWLNLLKGLVMAKEKDSRHYYRSRSQLRSRVRLAGSRPSQASSRHRVAAHRARSSSPTRTAVSYPFQTPPRAPAPQESCQYLTPPRSGSKRSASDAFSPTSASFPPIKPLKRPMGLSLEIPELVHSSASSSASSISPMEPLQSFSKLSIASSPNHVQPTTSATCSPAWQQVRQDQVPQTLVSAYRVDDKRQYTTPQNLYFYALAGSPMNAEDGDRPRKAHLRYHQPPPPIAPVPQYPHQHAIPLVVQSACASPHDHHMNLPPVPVLPHYTDNVWHRPQHIVQAPSQAYPHQQHMQPAVDTSVPAAPFANAGPPGVEFYNNNVSQRTSPEYYWARGRRS
ncbi:hypothetical protein ABKN59_004321 [Abortiporus biennis]